MQASKLKSPSRDPFFGQSSPRSSSLPFLSRSASSTPASRYSGHGLRGGADGASGGGTGTEDLKGKKLTMLLTRGSSFRRQGSSGMTWADNWIFTDDGMFLGRHGKVADDKGAPSPGPKKVSTSSSVSFPAGSTAPFPPELPRSKSVGGSVGQRSSKPKSHHRSGGIWGFKWIKKNFRKAFR